MWVSLGIKLRDHNNEIIYPAVGRRPYANRFLPNSQNSHQTVREHHPAQKNHAWVYHTYDSTLFCDMSCSVSGSMSWWTTCSRWTITPPDRTCMLSNPIQVWLAPNRLIHTGFVVHTGSRYVGGVKAFVIHRAADDDIGEHRALQKISTKWVARGTSVINLR
jgi:hypothetical protein